MVINFGFDISTIYYVDVEIEDEEIEEMTEEEILDYAINNYEDEACRLAERGCAFDVGALDTVSFNDKEHWVG